MLHLQRAEWWRLSLIVGIALVVRLLMIVWTYTGPYVLPENPMARGYLERGYRIAEGRGYVHEDGEPAMLHPPGVSLLSAAFRRALSRDADLPVQLVGAALDALAAGVVGWIAWVVFGSRAGYAAGLLYACFLPLAFVSVTKTADGMMTLFIAGASAMGIVGIAPAGRARWGAFAASGVLIGLGSYLRPDYAALPLVMLPVLWANWRRVLPALGAAAVMQGAVLLVLLPWAWRNHEICGRWIFTSTNVGPVLITGLGEYRNPWNFGHTDQDREREARAAGFSKPWSPEADVYFREMFRKAISEHPAGYAMAVAKRIPLAVATPLTWGFANPCRTVGLGQLQIEGADRYEVLRTRTGYVLAAYWDVLMTGGISALGLVCAAIMFWTERRRWALVILVLLPHLYAISTHLLTHMEPRFLLPSFYCWLIAFAYIIARFAGAESAAASSRAPETVING